MGTYTCRRKVSYPTKTQARKAARAARLRYKHPMYYYRCDICSKFHITKRQRMPRLYSIPSLDLRWWQ